jgi:DEAD/DEAH box helicase domain-containing protein
MLEHSLRLPRVRTLLPETPEISSVSTRAGEPAVFDAASIEGVVQALCERDDCQLVARIDTPKRAGRFAAWPDSIDEAVRTAFANRGVEQPYEHQVEALRAVIEGRDLVIATPTASGKSLCYRAPVLDACVRDASARALMLFPTKALSRDQVEGMRELASGLGVNKPPGAAVYDGDTLPDARRAARARASVVATNPDMLHRAILPNHDRWGARFSGLRFVVIDELHTYRGVFGSHVDNLLRRLWRVCAFYGSRPQVIACSATIANPVELTRSLISRTDVALIDRSTAPTGDKTFVVLNPAVVDETTGVRRSYLKVARGVTARVAESGVATLAFCRTRKAVELLTRYLREDVAKVDTDRFGVAQGPVDEQALSRAHKAIRGYRGGYLPEHRREVERALRSGEARVVASTNALELGMDVGGLDAVVLAGYPGTRAATFQRAGRAGRRGTPSLSVLILSSKPIDQFVANDPEFLFGRPPEHARVDPENPEILIPHLRCAVHELPMGAGEGLEGIAGSELTPLLDYLVESRVLFRDDAGEHPRYLSLGGDFPAQQIDLRGAMEENFTVIEVTSPGGVLRAESGRVLAEVDFEDGPLYLHPGAIYPLDGRTYEVMRLEWDARKAFVREVQSDYYTEAISKRRVRIVDPVLAPTAGQQLPSTRCEHGVGYAHVVRAVPGFKKLRFGSHENVGFGPIELPDLELHTVAAWWRMPAALLERLSDPERRAQAVLSAGHAVHFVAAMTCMCDAGDLGHAVGAGHEGAWAPVTQRARGGSTGAEAELVAGGLPTLYLYDRLSGGAGLTTRVHELGPEFFARVEAVVAGCACEDGCPSCVGAEGSSVDAPFGGRRDVLEVLRALREGVG